MRREMSLTVLLTLVLVLCATITVASARCGNRHKPATEMMVVYSGSSALDQEAGAGNTAILQNTEVAACHIDRADGLGVLSEIAKKANAVVGVEGIFPKTEKRTILDFPGGTVADLLDRFVALFPEYQWQEADGAIRVRAKRSRVSLANVVIAYPGASNKTRLEIWEDIGRRPEIAEWMKSNHCFRADHFHAKEFKYQRGPISVPAGPMTLAKLLDQVASQSGANYWAIVQSPPDQPCQVSIKTW